MFVWRPRAWGRANAAVSLRRSGTFRAPFLRLGIDGVGFVLKPAAGDTARPFSALAHVASAASRPACERVTRNAVALIVRTEDRQRKLTCTVEDFGFVPTDNVSCTLLNPGDERASLLPDKATARQRSS